MDSQGREEQITEEKIMEEKLTEEKSIEVETPKVKSTEETGPEKPKKDFPYAKIFSLAMMGLLCCLFVLGILLPLRPRYSDAEKREDKSPIIARENTLA